MEKTKILQKDASLLREQAKAVPVKSIKTKKIREIVSKMKRALKAEADGVAIAAPQIGESLRLFVVSDKAFTWSKKINKIDQPGKPKDMVFINPEIIKTSKKKKKVEEGCLSVRWLYGQVKRSEKVTLKAYDETGKPFERGASGLLAQIFQHETDHLNGILFTDKAENIRDLPPAGNSKIVFFGDSSFSRYVLEELKLKGFTPALHIRSAKNPLPMETLKKLEADVFVVASFGKILPKELIELPKHKTLNIHPSLLPKLRGPAPIQATILGQGEPGITIIVLDEEVDHGPILMQTKVAITPWPDHYRIVEEKLGRAGGRMLAALLSRWMDSKIRERPQDDTKASFTKLIKKEDGMIDLKDPAEKNLRKILAYSTWPGAYLLYKNKMGKEIRVVVKDAEIKNSQLVPTRVTPAGKREMDWQDFLRGN